MAAPRAPFQWAGNQPITSPQQAERARAVAAALAARPTPTNWGQGIAALTGGFVGGQLENQAAEAETLGQQSAAGAISGLSSGSSQADILAALSNPWVSQPQASVAQALLGNQMDQADPYRQLQVAQAQLDYDQDLAGVADGATEYGLTPIWGTLPDGTFGYGVQGKDGSFQQVETGELSPLDPRTLAGQRAAGTAEGKTEAEASASYPSAQLAVQAAKDTISSIRGNEQGLNEQFGNVLGVPQQVLPVWPGSARANLQVDLSQVQGQAFIQAREFLKGQGQITDFESQRAEAAFSRLEKASAMGDRASFMSALDDFESALDAGLAKVAAQSGASQAGAPAADGWTDLGGGISIRPLGQ